MNFIKNQINEKYFIYTKIKVMLLEREMKQLNNTLEMH